MLGGAKRHQQMTPTSDGSKSRTDIRHLLALAEHPVDFSANALSESAGEECGTSNWVVNERNDQSMTPLPPSPRRGEVK